MDIQGEWPTALLGAARGFLLTAVDGRGNRPASRDERGMILVKPEWGTKRICQSCGARFYDFQRSPIACPACGAAFELETLQRSRRSRAPVRAPVVAAAVVAAPAETDELEAVVEETTEEGDFEDADELGEENDVDVEVVRPDDEDENP
jgi:uncharacterized protein (TIGR02300 family)